MISVSSLARCFAFALLSFAMASELLAVTKSTAVQCQIIPGMSDKKSWELPKSLTPMLEYEWPAFGFSALPKHYDERGLIADRPAPFLFRVTSMVTLPAGEQRLLLRYRGTARLYVNGKLLGETKFRSGSGDGHGHVPDFKAVQEPGLAQLPADHQELLVTVKLDGKPAQIQLDAIVADQGLRPELGELSISHSPVDSKSTNAGEPTFRLLGAGEQPLLSEAGWLGYLQQDRQRVAQYDQKRRQTVQTKELAYWKTRHERAAKVALGQPIAVPPVEQSAPNQTPLDRLLVKQLLTTENAPREFAPLLDDLAFLRRLALDTVGVIPSPSELHDYQQQPVETRRDWAIDRYLADPRWADHNVSYWQDVLAENPGIVKPELNNSGPFRYWIHESLLDNKPLDRFATELVMMQGSALYGGPAGFGIASQNDAPLAEKAHILAKAFLAIELKCARCHDAPYHDFKQADTFELSAMLARKEQALPKTSTVPVAEGARKPLVTISLKAGAKLQPHWPFGQLVDEKIADSWARDPQDTRQRLAALITAPENQRFAQVLVNRAWVRLIGWGLVDQVDDWENIARPQESVLRYLAQQFVGQGYDLRKLQAEIFRSRLYQTAATVKAGTSGSLVTAVAIGPARRRLTAEQLVDSLFSVAQRPLGCEELTFDPAGRSPAKSFHNLGIPSRAWQFVSLSNERDRPALALPVAQTMLDVLTTFGWRESRQNPISTRDDDANALQPLALANGMLSIRVATLTADSALTRLTLREQSVEQLIEQLFLQLLTRQPTAHEISLVSELLSPGYEQRLQSVADDSNPLVRRTAVSWSNHLSPEATQLKLELERYARAGDPGTKQLTAAWREQAEDAIWAIINSPEFVFVP